MTDAGSGMQQYYADRAPVYDRVYGYPERQHDLRYLEETLPPRFDDLMVLEVAAGTGYWTRHIAARARSILATDATESTLAQLELRNLPESVETMKIDAYRLQTIDRRFNGAFAGLWFSHVPIARRGEFLGSLHSVLEPGARVVLLDNSKAQCDRLPIVHEDEYGNTFQDRTTDDGTVHRVLKNFPTESQLRALVADATEIHFEALEHFWLFEYRR